MQCTRKLDKKYMHEKILKIYLINYLKKFQIKDFVKKKKLSNLIRICLVVVLPKNVSSYL